MPDIINKEQEYLKIVQKCTTAIDKIENDEEINISTQFGNLPFSSESSVDMNF